MMYKIRTFNYLGYSITILNDWSFNYNIEIDIFNPKNIKSLYFITFDWSIDDLEGLIKENIDWHLKTINK